MYISVIGGDTPRATEENKKKAEKVGKAIAERGHDLVCGGRGGVMKAACKGAKEKGGTTIGILPSSNRDEANEYVDHPIVTDLGMLRNSLVVQNGDIIIAVDGGYGTLSEICIAQKYGKRILGLGTWDVDAVESFEEVQGMMNEISKLES